ncbi:MAG: serine/threonine-protein kinase [Microbacteriaceae bacterium]
MSRRAASQPPELPGLTFVKLLGSGGFSDVFLYEQALPRRRVAVKVMLADHLDESAQRAFVDEANLMAQLSAHPYIVTIFHADFAADGRPYLMMEYCSGPSLAERYKAAPLAVPDVLRTGIRLSGAIATAHAAGILHRDIKPGNVLANDFGWPALTDFGIASTIDETLPVHTTSTGDLFDTASSTGSESVGMSVPWSPPEMFEERPQPDARSDIFSLAATMHTLLTGRTPFEIPGRSNGVLDLIGRIERGAVSPIARDDVPRSLASVLAKGMATRRSERYASVIEFARALQRVELELGYATTSIDVPSLVVQNTAEAVGDDEDATSLRSVSTIAAQRVEDPPPAAAETALRGVTEVNASPTGTADAGEQTVLRPRPAPTAPAPAAAASAPAASAPAASTAPAAATDATGAESPDAPAKRRPRVAAIAIGAVLVLLAGGVGTSIALGGGQEADPRPTASSGPGDSAIIGGQVPSPEFVEVRDSSASEVTFVWDNPDPEEGDSYRWALAENPNDQKGLDEAEVTVERPSANARVCIEVVILRAGRTSPVPLERCDPE